MTQHVETCPVCKGEQPAQSTCKQCAGLGWMLPMKSPPLAQGYSNSASGEKRLEIASRNLAAILTNDYWMRWLHEDVETRYGNDGTEFKSMCMAKSAAVMALLHADALLTEVNRPIGYVEPLEKLPEEPKQTVLCPWCNPGKHADRYFMCEKHEAERQAIEKGNL